MINNNNQFSSNMAKAPVEPSMVKAPVKPSVVKASV
jgi:hypothetical protein